MLVSSVAISNPLKGGREEKKNKSINSFFGPFGGYSEVARRAKLENTQ